MSYKSPLVILTAITVIFLTFLAAVVAFQSEPDFIINRQAEDRIYSKCIRKVKLDSTTEQMLEWIDRCNEIAKTLATESCRK